MAATGVFRLSARSFDGSHGCESSDVVQFDRVPLLQGQTRITKLKCAYNLLIIGPGGLQCETNILEIMGCESSDVVRFDLGSLLQGQKRIKRVKSVNNLLIIGPRDLQYETNL